ncbi:2-C-methyl-D-erythritol 4-phosphate cytidylyltransferase [Lacihabitans soyangensis]|uniref:2-C-methyl-D-erythritol 4-phosphate cytidylyltransferase n=1 Tax=Lacihabitans soyangensis TaxID=869394 RepID=A0AAE3H2W2_9BACT|nr:2-C-methyl-D-erythritol 4-phosphate cytidylyltransferase [Lacihabitans soyangensis]MCP9763903.1 2-C-methyl-D-erythritol 4-phosphate cytidylyltransferase [Lacihabitans soyangensis]
MTNKYAIIVAGGSGSRMQSAIPKQFLHLGDKPILVHTIEKFLQIPHIQIVLALPADALEYWEKVGSIFFDDLSQIRTVEGGKTRFQSVKNALFSIEQNAGLVAVHDGVRPFVSSAIIQKSFEVAAQKKSAVVCVDSKDSVRLLDGNDNKSVDRKNVKLIQTPQTFDLELLKKAYQVDDNELFTDDASVVEHFGQKIFLIDGDYKNIKITSPEDMEIGGIFLKNSK